MLRFHAEHFVQALSTLSGVRFALVRTDSSLYTDAIRQEELRQTLRTFESWCEDMKLNLTAAAVRELSDIIKESIKPTSSLLIEHRLMEIEKRLKHEFETNLFLKVDQRRMFEQPQPLFGELVEKQFPSAAPEIDAAGKCLALCLPTASVMHLMRVLELGLHSLATATQVSFANPNWHTLIDQIESKIRTMNLNTHGPNWRADRQFYSEAAVHFRLLKDAWRNHSMHIHDRYSDERAETIFQSVRGFMQHLATKLSEAP